MPTTARTVLTLLPVLVVLGAAPATAADGDGDGWTLAPSGDQRPTAYAEGPPGAVLRDSVTLTNPATHPVTVRLRGTGAAPVALADTGVRVPARTRAEIPFTVTVPQDAPPGVRRATLTARDGTGRTRSLSVHLRVTGPALAALTVERVRVHADRIGYELVNRGTTVLVPRLAVRADGVLGPLLDRAPRALPVELPPGHRLKLSEPWPDRPALDAVDVTLTVTAAGGARDTARVSARFVPWREGAGAAGVLAAVGAGLAVRRRRRRTTGGEWTGEVAS
ncbi:hypothetical protein [Streptomyces sp. NPDC057877]|uniref:COG1470 family protein n=1 Tax=Streptomyces sp. NPDC057877 TaxID=3346269 RepID=UPI0036874B85